MKKFKNCLAVFAAMLIFGLLAPPSCNKSDKKAAQAPAGAVAVFYSVNDDPIAAQMAHTLGGYLVKMNVPDVRVVGFPSGVSPDQVAEEVDATFWLNPRQINPGVMTDSAKAAAIPPEGYWVKGISFHDKPAIMIMANDKLGLQYGVYDMLHEHGVRFLHPEEEWLPPVFIMKKRIDKYESSPFKWRGYALHTTHPLELNIPLGTAQAPFSYVQHWLDWVVKMHGNQGKGARSGVASGADYDTRRAEIDAYNALLGFKGGAGGISFHSSQQGGSPDIDWSKTQAEIEADIKSIVDSRLAGYTGDGYFSFSYGPTEYTTTPCDETYYYLDFGIRYILNNYPGVKIKVGSHITGNEPCKGTGMSGADFFSSPWYSQYDPASQARIDEFFNNPTANYFAHPDFADYSPEQQAQITTIFNNSFPRADLDYRDMPILADPRVAISYHTVMMYDLVGPAPVYNREDFNIKLEYMLEETLGREEAGKTPRDIIWFPEGAWWLGIDNNLPLFLPIHVYTRWIDMRLVKPMLGHGLTGHDMFTTGQEWGYWMQDYAVGRMQWNPNLDWKDIIAEFTVDIMGRAGPAVHRVLAEMCEFQYQSLINDGLMKYMIGIDPETELGALVGVEGHELPESFASVDKMDIAQLQAFRTNAIDKLKAMAEQYDAYRFDLAMVAPYVAPSAASIFREIYDGTEIDALRAWQAYHTYNAVALRREGLITGNQALIDRGWQSMTEAENIVGAAMYVIARRELDYRYPLDWSSSGGVTPETAVDNETTWDFRVLTKAHTGYYWTRRDTKARAVMEGNLDPFTQGFWVEPAIADAGTRLNLHYPSIEGVTVAIDFGDGSLGDQTDMWHDYAGPGYWLLHGDVAITNYPPETYDAVVARVDSQVLTNGTFNLITPSDPTIEQLLKLIFPTVQMGISLTAPQPFMAIGLDMNGDDRAEAATAQAFPLATWDATSFETQSMPFTFYFKLTEDGLMATVDGIDYILRGTLSGGLLQNPVTMEGNLSIQSIVDIAVQAGAFDEQGIKQLLAGLLGIPVDQLPPYLHFEADIGVSPL